MSDDEVRATPIDFATPTDFAAAEPHAAVGESCDYCGAETLAWRKCKLICASCHMINKSCADL